MSLDLIQIARIQAQLAALETPEAPPLTSEELQHYWDRGNERRPIRPRHSDNTKVNIVNGQRRWIAFCASLPNAPAWKPPFENTELGQQGSCRVIRQVPGAEA